MNTRFHKLTDNGSAISRVLTKEAFSDHSLLNEVAIATENNLTLFK